MILCLAQISPCWNDPIMGLAKIRTKAEEASRFDASFIVFPEQILTGWDPMDIAWAETEEGKLVSTLREIAYELNIGLLGSYREWKEDGPRNTCIAIGKDGKILARYSKIHLFSPGGEDKKYKSGENLEIFSIDSCIIGLAICYDLRFAQLFQLYRQKGVHMMLVPSAWPASRIHPFHLFTKSRAAEFQFFVASVNTVGETPVDTYSGESLISGPDGTVRVKGSFTEELIYYDIRVDEVTDIRTRFPVFNDSLKTDYQEIKKNVREPLSGY